MAVVSIGDLQRNRSFTCANVSHHGRPSDLITDVPGAVERDRLSAGHHLEDGRGEIEGVDHDGLAGIVHPGPDRCTRQRTVLRRTFGLHVHRLSDVDADGQAVVERTVGPRAVDGSGPGRLSGVGQGKVVPPSLTRRIRGVLTLSGQGQQRKRWRSNGGVPVHLIIA